MKCSNPLRLAAIRGRPTWSSSLWSWSFPKASESAILVFRRLKNFLSSTTSSVSVKNVCYILLCLFTVIYFFNFLCCVNLVFYCLSVNLAMSFQRGSDGSTSSNSPTLVQANFTNFEMLDFAKTESVAPIDSTGGSKGVPDVTRKFLTRHRKLMGKLTKMQKDFKLCSTPEQFKSCSTNFDALKSSFALYCRDLKLLVTDPDKFDESSERLKDAYDNCCDNYDECKVRVVGCPHDDSEDESVVQSAESASQVTGYTATTDKSCEI